MLGHSEHSKIFMVKSNFCFLLTVRNFKPLKYIQMMMIIIIYFLFYIVKNNLYDYETGLRNIRNKIKLKIKILE